MYCIATNKTQCTALQTITLCALHCTALHATHLCALHWMHCALHFPALSLSQQQGGREWSREGTQQVGRKAGKVCIVFPLPSYSTIFILFAFRWILQLNEFTWNPQVNQCSGPRIKADILNVSTITTSGCAKKNLTGVNLVLHTYDVFSKFFVSFLHSFCVKIQANEGKK